MLTRRLFALIVLSTCAITTGRAAQQATSGSAPDEESESLGWGGWWVCGPFGRLEKPYDLEPEYWPERELLSLGPEEDGPDRARREPGFEGADVGWHAVAAEAGREGDLDVGKLEPFQLTPPPRGVQGWGSYSTYYLWRTVEAEDESVVELLPDGWAAVALWLDGRQVLSERLYGVARDRVLRLRIEPGRHHVVLKLAGGRNRTSIRLRPLVPLRPEEMQEILGRGRAGLLDAQFADGSWGGSEEQRERLTIRCLEALLLNGCDEGGRVPAWALASLADAGPMRLEHAPSLVRALARAQDAALRRVCGEALELLLQSQQRRGGWSGRSLVFGSEAADALAYAQANGWEVPEESLSRIAQDALDLLEVHAPRRRAMPAGFRAGEGRESQVDALATARALLLLSVVEPVLDQAVEGDAAQKLRRLQESALQWLASHPTWRDLPFEGVAANEDTEFLLTLLRALERGGRSSIPGWSLETEAAAYLRATQSHDGTWYGGRSWSEADRTSQCLCLAALLFDVDPPDSLVAVGDMGLLELTAGESPSLRFVPSQAEFECKVQLSARERGSDQSEDLASETLGGEGPDRLECPLEIPRDRIWMLWARVNRAGITREWIGPLRIGGQTHAAGPRLSLSGNPEWARETKATVTDLDGEEDRQLETLLDGRLDQVWRVDEDVESSGFRVKFRRARRARGLLLVPANARFRDGANAAHVTRIRITLNGKIEWEVELSHAPFARHELPFEKDYTVRTLQVEVLAEAGVASGTESAGFAELTLRQP